MRSIYTQTSTDSHFVCIHITLAIQEQPLVFNAHMNKQHETTWTFSSVFIHHFTVFWHMTHLLIIENTDSQWNESQDSCLAQRHAEIFFGDLARNGFVHRKVMHKMVRTISDCWTWLVDRGTGDSAYKTTNTVHSCKL